MLPPLFWSVRVPTLMAILWRSLFSEKRAAQPSQRGSLSIIIFRLDAMGDVVMTTSLLRELKHTFPKSHCTVVVQPNLRALLVTNPHIDEILTPPEVAAPRLPRRACTLAAAILLYWRRSARKALRCRYLTALGRGRTSGHFALCAYQRDQTCGLHRESDAA